MLNTGACCRPVGAASEAWTKLCAEYFAEPVDMSLTSFRRTIARPHCASVAVPRCGQIVARLPNLAGPQIVARPPNLAVLLTHSGQLILRKISKCGATRCQILRLKCTKFDFRWGYSAPPDPLGVFNGAYF